MSTTEPLTELSSVHELFTREVSNDPAVATNPKDELYSLCDDPMTQPMKLINENLRFEDSQKLRGYFIENTGFLVVGVIGLKGVGKSSVANLLANRLVEGPPFDGPFPVQSLDSLVDGYPATTAGVDIYITQDRVIILDTQPLLDWSLTDLHIQNDLRIQKQQHPVEDHSGMVKGPGNSPNSEKWSVDGFAEITSIQLVSFLVSVCHVVMCVQDNLSNPSFLRLIDRALGLKPLILVDDIVTTSTFGGGPSFSKGNRRQPLPMTELMTVESEAVDPKVKTVETAVHEAEEEEEDEEEEEGGVACGNEAPGSDETGLGQTSTAAPKVCAPPDAVAVVASTQTRIGSVEEVAEQAEVRDFVTQLLKLTDYTASLVHVYNCAPVGAFVNSRISDDRLLAYRRLLTQAFPSRLHLSSLVSMGPRILQRHIFSRQRRLREQKQEAATTTPSIATADMDGNVQLVSTSHLTDEQNNRPMSTVKGGPSMEATEAEIVKECYEELDMVARGIRGPRRSLVKVRTPTATETATVAPIMRTTLKSTTGEIFDGEDRVAALKDFARRVTERRKMYFEPSASVASPRLFLLPATNEKGEVAFGSATYAQCAYLLQEAVLSTPRRHPTLARSSMTELQWFKFAQQTWNSLGPSSSSSPLSEYHRLLVSNSLI